MLAFYRSPVGEKLLRKQPEIFRASSEAGRQWAAEISQRLRARLTEKGYAASWSVLGAQGRRATRSISTRAFFGRAAACTVERAGLWSPKAAE
jgi:hypothetical protein